MDKHLKVAWHYITTKNWQQYQIKFTRTNIYGQAAMWKLPVFNDNKQNL